MAIETMKNGAATEKLEEALDLLSEAAKDKREELMMLLDEKYTDVRMVLSEMAVNNREIVRQLKRRAEEKVQRNPLGVVGGVAAGTLLLGYILGSNSNRRM